MKKLILTCFSIFMATASPSFGQVFQDAWTLDYNSSTDVEIISMESDTAGDIYVYGHWLNTVDFDPSGTLDTSSTSYQENGFLAKYDDTGTLLWYALLKGVVRSTGSTNPFVRATDMDVSDNGDVYITGKFASHMEFQDGGSYSGSLYAGTVQDIFVAKYDKTGDFLWSFNIGGNNSKSVGLAHVAVDDTNTFVYLTGECSKNSNNSGIDFDPSSGVYRLTSDNPAVFVAKYAASNHALQWAFNIGGDETGTGYGNNLGTDIVLTSDKDIYITGRIEADSVDFDPGTDTAYVDGGNVADAFLAKYDSSGNYSWAVLFGNETGYCTPNNVAIDADDRPYILGDFTGTVDFDPDPSNTVNKFAGAGRDIFLNAFTTAGVYRWVAQFGTSDQVQSFDLEIDDASSVYLTGYLSDQNQFDADPTAGTNLLSVDDGSSTSDWFLIKLGTDMSFDWAAEGKDDTGGDKEGRAIALLDGSVAIAGVYRDSMDVDQSASEQWLVGDGDGDGFIVVYGTSLLSRGFTATPIQNELDFASTEVSVYPNPFAEGFTINWTTDVPYAQARLLDGQGKEIRPLLKIQKNQYYHLDKSIAPGLYYLEVEIGNQIIQQKLIRQ